MKFALAFTLVLLCGCAQRNRQADALNQGAAIDRIAAMRAETAKDDATPAALRDVTASNNATQQSLTGFGVQVSKIAESFKLFGDSLAHVEARVESNVKASAVLNADVRNTLETKLEVHASNQMKLLSDFEAKMDAKFTAQGAGMAGLRNELSMLTQNVSSGRDSNVQTINFSKEMRDTLIQSYESQVKIIIYFCGALTTIVSAIVTGLCGVMTAMAQGSRKREEQRHKETKAQLEKLKGV